MDSETSKSLKQLYKQLGILRTYEHALGIISFDFETCAPKKSREAEGNVMSFLSNEAFKISNSKRMKELIVFLNGRKDELSPLDRVLIDILYENYLKEKNITPKLQLEVSEVFNKAYIDWLEAKSKSDFSLFAGSLQAVLDASKTLVDLRENKLPDFYDNLLNDCEKGILTADLDKFFSELKEGLLDLVNRIKASEHIIRTDFLSRKVPVYKQEMFSEYLLKLNGYDFDRGCLSTTEHPFTSDVAKDDARVTTHYHEDMVLSTVYSVIHEGGHAIFMQNEREEDYEHFINDNITNGMHESVSRFYENVIGRSKEYIRLIYPEFIRVFGEEFGDVSERELYEAVNYVQPSLIRTEADEVTYGLHIVIRYEMEKAICSGKISISEVPEKWNALYREYLGVTPENDGVGALQDVHWTGAFGYFPSYALGNAYNAMYLKRISSETDFKNLILAGDFATINEWMRKNVFLRANELSPKQWLKELTGEELSAKAFLGYLSDKYSEIYKI